MGIETSSLILYTGIKAHPCSNWIGVVNCFYNLIVIYFFFNFCLCQKLTWFTVNNEVLLPSVFCWCLLLTCLKSCWSSVLASKGQIVKDLCEVFTSFYSIDQSHISNLSSSLPIWQYHCSLCLTCDPHLMMETLWSNHHLVGSVWTYLSNTEQQAACGWPSEGNPLMNSLLWLQAPC